MAIHAGSESVDLVLPRGVPLGALLPDVCGLVDDAMPGGTGVTGRPAVRLSAPGRPPLDLEKTLSENGITDGALLLLTVEPRPPAVPPVLDCGTALGRLGAADARAAAPVAAAGAAAMIAVPLAAVGGALAVPGAPAAPHLLLGASAAGALAAVAAHRAEQGRIAFTAVAFGAALIAAVSLGVTAFGGSVQFAGILLTAAGVGVLAGAGRLTLLICGVSPAVSRDLEVAAVDPVSAPVFAPQCLTAVLLAGACDTTVGVLLTVARHPGAAHCALAGIVAATLLLRARAHATAPRRTALLLCGTCCAALTLISVGLIYPVTSCWLGAAALAAAVTAIGFNLRRRRPPPLAGQLAHVAECAGLLGVIPAACWTLGLFDAVRAMGSA